MEIRWYVQGDRYLVSLRAVEAEECSFLQSSNLMDPFLKGRKSLGLGDE